MKALSMLQPWAQLLMMGAKHYETRSWRSKHRGPLLIHAGRSFPQATRDLCGSEPYRSALAGAGIDNPSDLPRGVLLGTITLETCLATEEAVYHRLADLELALGNFQPGRWAWKMSDPRPWLIPVPYAGNLGVFEVDLPCEVYG